ncbi:MAG: hypothetical protein ACUVYA_15635, partial [Planctomycetota bacterium]
PAAWASWIWIPFAAACVLAWGWVSAFAVREAAAGAAPRLRDLAREVALRSSAFYLAPAGTILVPMFLAALALAGSLVARIPFAGAWLGAVWLWTGGLALGIFAGAWVLLAAPSLLVQIPAAAAEFPHAYEIVTRAMDYVRRRPLVLAAGSLAVLGASLAGTAVFGIAVSAALAVLSSAAEIERGALPCPSQTARAVASVWLDPGTWWPAGRGALAALGLPAEPSSARWLVPVARAAPAFFAASVLSGLARLYLVLRREVDGTPVSEVYEVSAARRRNEGSAR